MQNNRWLQALIILLVIIASAWLAGQVWGFVLQFSNILLLFFLAWLLAFILRPIARWLHKSGLPYTLSVAVVYLSLTIVLVISGVLLVPVISTQVEQLFTNSGAYTNQILALIGQGQDILKGWGVQSGDLDRITSDLVNQAQSALVSVLQNTLALLQSVATVALQIIFIFLISFYIMNDGDKLAAGVLHLLPPRWEDEIRLAALSIEKSFGGFIRGQIVFGLIYGVFTAVVMIVPPFQLDYVVIAAIVSGFCMLIPLVGNFIAYVPPLLVCIVTKPSQWLLLLIALFIAQSIMMNVVGPRVMSSALGLHPVYVVAAMLLGGQVAGVWGALFGIPVAGAVNLIGRPLMRRVRHQMPLYQEIGSRSLPTSAFVTGPLAASLVKAEETRTLSSGTVSHAEHLDEAAPVAVTAQTPDLSHIPSDAEAAMAEAEADADLLIRHSPTLSARAFRLIIVLGSRAVNWAWSRTRREASETNKS
ncbi:MAG: AI-2E family transporter [Chloroflexota bacterium]